jgi:hypothetical protein
MHGSLRQQGHMTRRKSNARERFARASFPSKCPWSGHFACLASLARNFLQQLLVGREAFQETEHALDGFLRLMTREAPTNHPNLL